MEYTTLEQVKIRLKQFHIDTVTNDDETTSDVVVFDKKEDNPLIEQLICLLYTSDAATNSYV